MNHKINMALQVLPKKKGEENVYPLVDEAIKVIHDSGVKYRVCPFETVMEGTYDQLMAVAKKAIEACFLNGAEEMLTYIKIQIRKNEDVLIEDKMEKYE